MTPVLNRSMRWVGLSNLIGKQIIDPVHAEV